MNSWIGFHSRGVEIHGGNLVTVDEYQGLTEGCEGFLWVSSKHTA